MMLSISLKRFYTVFMMMTVTVAASLVLVPGSSLAGDTICVICKNPDLTYRCKVIRDDGTFAGLSYQFHCIKEIAREGGHQSCSVRRHDGDVCEGLEKTIIYNGHATTPPGNQQSVSGPRGQVPGEMTGQDSGQAAAPEAGSAGEVRKGEPRTLIELGEETAKGTQRQIKKTGQAIGGAAKKTGDTVVGAVKKTGQAIGGAAKKTSDTVVGAVKTTGDTVGGAVKTSGKAIGSAAKSTLNCVTSLFTKCF